MVETSGQGVRRDDAEAARYHVDMRDPPVVHAGASAREAVRASYQAVCVKRRIAIAIAVVGAIGILVPLSQAAFNALVVARADLGTFSIDDVSGFLTASGSNDAPGASKPEARGLNDTGLAPTLEPNPRIR